MDSADERMPRLTTFRSGRISVLPAVLALLVAGLLLVVGLSSCGRERVSPDHQPLRLQGLPTIRVRLTAAPVSTAEVSATAGCRIEGDGQTVFHAAGAADSVRVELRDRTWHFAERTSSADYLEVTTGREGLLAYGGTDYRGRLRLVPADDGRFIVVNYLDLESYLAGVIGKELYSSWSYETYRAQAIAARTFALYQVTHFGRAHDYDLGDNQAWQVYGGFSAETDVSWRAVRQTHGTVLAFGPPGREQIFLAQYSACCGGVVNGAAVLRNAPDIPPLAGGQDCDDCGACRYYRWPPVTLAKQDIYQAVTKTYPSFGKLTGLKAIRVVSTTDYGRPVQVKMIDGSGAAEKIRYDDLRLAVLRGNVAGARGLRSMNCRMRDLGSQIEFYDGRGFGHAVGLCQWGAQGKAIKGWAAERILGFYYPGATRIEAY